MVPAEPWAPARRRSLAGVGGPGSGCTVSSASTSSQICVQLVDVEIVEAVLVDASATSTSSGGRRYSPELISVPPPTQHPSA